MLCCAVLWRRVAQAAEKITGLVSLMSAPTTDKQTQQIATELLAAKRYIPVHPLNI